MRKSLLLAAMIAVSAVISGCSAGGSATASSSTTATASDLLVTVTTPTAGGLQDTGAEVATVTVTAVDSNRNAVSGVTVTIVPDSSAVVSVSGTTTDTSGVVTGSVGIGTDHSNRTVTVLAKSGSITKSVTFAVTGATLTATLTPAVVVPGATGTIQYHLADSAGTALAGVSIAVSGSLPTTTGVTDANGNFTYSYTAPTTAQVLSVTATGAGVTVVSSITDSSGSIADAVGTVVTKSLSADPSSVSVNADGGTTNQVSLRATFAGANNQPIPNIRVRFDLDGDTNGIGGTLTSGSDYVYTDSNGVARTSYIPGVRSSGNNKLVLRACWSNSDFAVISPAGAACPNSQELTANITVSGASIGVAYDTDNTITVLSTSPVIYQIGYAVQVTDSAGNPQSDVRVSAVADLPRYYKGQYQVVNAAWALNGYQSCTNEDVNRNASKDDFGGGMVEDANNSGALEPFQSSVVITPQTPTVGTTHGTDYTDAFGRAYFYLQYGTNYATWEDYVLTFSASVSGSEGSKSTDARPLPAPATAFTSTTVALPFQTSPYGTDPNSPYTTVTDPTTGVSYSLCTESPANVIAP